MWIFWRSQSIKVANQWPIGFSLVELFNCYYFLLSVAIGKMRSNRTMIDHRFWLNQFDLIKYKFVPTDGSIPIFDDTQVIFIHLDKTMQRYQTRQMCDKHFIVSADVTIKGKYAFIPSNKYHSQIWNNNSILCWWKIWNINFHRDGLYDMIRCYLRPFRKFNYIYASNIKRHGKTIWVC